MNKSFYWKTNLIFINTEKQLFTKSTIENKSIKSSSVKCLSNGIQIKENTFFPKLVTSSCYLDYVLFLTISRWRLMLIWQVSRELNEMHLFEKKQKLKRNWQVMSKISQVWCQKFLIMSTLKRRNRNLCNKSLIYFSSISNLY